MPNANRFDDVRELLQRGKTDQARVLLRMMGDDPQAQQWLARLNQVSPPKPDGVVRPALDEIDQIKPKVRTQPGSTAKVLQRMWIGVRVLGVVVFLLQLVWILPLLGRLGILPEAVTEVEMPAVIEDALDIVVDSPVGKAVTDFTDETIAEPIQRANDNVQEEVISRGFQQAAPMLDQICEQNDLTPSQKAVCRDTMNDMQSCLARGGSMDSCLDEVMLNVCQENFGGNPAGYNACMQQMQELKARLP